MRMVLMSLAAGLAIAAAGAPQALARELTPAAKRQHMMAGVKSWGYQLQKMDVDALEASPFDMLVIDHAPDRVESVELMFRRDEIEVLKTKPDGTRRLVLAYISIGEAERYRFYWDDAWLEPGRRPLWLGPVNPQWVGNYPVEFWQPEWQALIFGRSGSYIERVLDAGFDGLYLDRADVFEMFPAHPNAEAEMASFVSRLADHARAIKPDAIVVMQNAEELVRHKEVRAHIDAIAKESLYFNPDSGSAVPLDDTRAALADLRLARKANRKVLVVEYTSDPMVAKAARRQADAEGFLIHFAERTLSNLNARAPDQQVTADAPAGTPAPVR